jgi:queuine tRNA-ribosyltransferase
MRHLDRCNEILASMLATIHNLHYYQTLMKEIRQAIEKNEFEAFRTAFYAQRSQP